MKKFARQWLAAVVADVGADFTESDFRRFVAWILLDPVAAEVRSLLMERLGVELAEFSFEDDLERLDRSGLHRFCQNTDTNRLRQLLGSAKFIRLANERLQSDFLPEPQVQLSEQSTWGIVLTIHNGIAAATDEEIVALDLAYRNKLVRFAFDLVGDIHVAEDMVQDVMIRLRNANAKSEGHLRNIAFRAVRQVIIERMRRKSAKQLVGVEADLAGGVPVFGSVSVDSPEQIVARKETAQIVAEAVSRLSKRQAEVLKLDCSGMSYQQIADLLHIKVSSVGSTLAKAREVLSEVPALRDLVTP
jgi:RNA polymerase sigma factor (sigma-70 family)